MAYVLPQVLINQIFNQVSLNTIKDLNVLVIGPNYQIFRYSDPTFKKELFIGGYNGKYIDQGTGEDIRKVEYPDRPADSVVDENYVKLFGDDVMIELVNLADNGIDGFYKLTDEEAGADLDGCIKFNVPVAGEGRDKTIFPRSIVPGDVIHIKYGSNGETFESTVLEVYASDEDLPENQDCLRIADTLPPELRPEADSNEQVYVVAEVSFCASLTGVEIPREADVSPDATRALYQWLPQPDDVILYPTLTEPENLTIAYPAWDNKRHEIISAKLYVEYRALLHVATDAIHSIERSTDVANMLGQDDVDNPLAFGVKKCTQNSADRTVYYMATRGETLEDYQRVLEAAAKTDKVYFIVPLTRDEAVITAVQAHVDEMSSKENKRWRIAFVCSEIPEENRLYTKAASTDGEGFFGIIGPPNNLSGDKNNIIFQFVEGDDPENYRPATGVKCNSQVVAGDKVRVYDGGKDIWTGKDTYTDYTVDTVISNTVLRLKSGPKDPIETKRRSEVIHLYTYAEKTTAIASTSRNMADRRMYNVFPNWVGSEGITFGGEFAAAAAAGLASSVLPQQPITNVELVGIDDVPICYETYTRTQLNEIAEGGTFIIMQDLPGDRVYVRHQLSTDYVSGNLLKSELSITKNLDSISYYFAEVYKPYIGKYNITPKLIEQLRAEAEGALSKLESETGAGILIGPQVLAEGTEIVTFEQDQVNQDHVYAHIKLNLPRPFNVLDLDLEVI